MRSLLRLSSTVGPTAPPTVRRLEPLQHGPLSWAMLPDVLDAPAIRRASTMKMPLKSDVRLRRLDQVREDWGQEVKG